MIDPNEELAYFAYDWLRSHDTGNGYAGHNGMRKVTLDGQYDLVGLFEEIRKRFGPSDQLKDLWT
jgi:hypothetical protein